MEENKEKSFHEYALQSSLFKGQSHIYFSYLKSEKLAFAISRIVSLSNKPEDAVLKELSEKSMGLANMQAQFAAHVIPAAYVLAGIFQILTLIRLAVERGLLVEQNGRILCREYELVARKTTAEPSFPYLTLSDLTVSEIPEPSLQVPAFTGHKGQKDITDTKGHDKGQNQRQASILKVITENKRVSIKDISNIVRDCSEKTIQRELGVLIEQGLVRKEGNKRWSIYLSVK